ncbi:unnamed protein product [Nippostrongylus brasiliensis]|uniref:Cyclopropane-fatty-acyl-phospholipid synthase n=1 Tax=Nippostrongylus brasiliensis TaxID=27835 RepID=A0A158R1G8_NIPBR|nr:unnamed protein product [Nippostrongylus brasiliensis]
MSGDRQPSAGYSLLVRYACLPFITRFLDSIVGKSSEKLKLCVTSTGDDVEFDGREVENNNECTKTMTMFMHNPVHFCWLMLLDQKMGLGETYMAGDWTAEPNPTELLKLLIRAKKQGRTNQRRPATLFSKFIKFTTENLLNLLRRTVATYRYIQHRIRDNTLTQSAKNIEEHYDLGNDMFRMFLDPSMTYSCALFEEPLEPVDQVDFKILEEAQNRKMDRMIGMLDLKENDRVLEIGCGWGSCAIRAVQNTRCDWTGITISHEQLEWARRKVEEAELQEHICFKYQDYRLTSGQYDKVISVEMVEAVGQAFLPQYFQVLSDRLAPGGIAVLQGIICPDAYYDRYCRSSDFIKKYIFPGGHMPSIGAIKASLPKDLTLGEMKHIGRHYAATLDHWYSAWMKNEKRILALGYSESFHRRWQYYFCLCSALFANDHIDTIQFTLTKAS